MLLKELPEAMRGSVEAYIGCLSKAVMKEKYLGLIGKAGFQDIILIEETPFPVDFMVNDSFWQAINKNLAIPPEMVR